jgi:hypothetical protein
MGLIVAFAVLMDQDRPEKGRGAKLTTGMPLAAGNGPPQLADPRYLRIVHRLLPTLLFLATFSPGGPAYAQTSIQDTMALVAMSATYAYQLPSGDLANRFGANHNVGLSALRKTRRNYLIGLEGGFLFGSNVKEPGLMRGLINRQGQIVDQDGVMADIQVFQRGWTAFATVGKIIAVAGPNINSGIMLKAGAGYMRHKIRIQTQRNEVPQLQGDYLEGYDRLAAGPAALLYFGYQHFGNNRRINFNMGFEFTMGLTEPLRAYNFDTRSPEKGRRFDGLTAFRAGWTIPIYKRMDDRYHYY